MLLYRVGINLSAEQNRDRLMEMILLEAKELCHADGGTLYLRGDDDALHFEILRTDSLGIAAGGTSDEAIDLPPIPLFGEDGEPNVANVASYAAVLKRSVNIPDAYDHSDFDFSGTRAFDDRAGYRSTSFLTIPLVNSEDRVIGVLQLLNAQDPQTGEVVPFRHEDQEIVEALASQAAVALDNQLLLDAQKELLQAFIRLIASAIDAKSPYTGGHCERVPVVAEMLAHAACGAKEGVFADFNLDEGQWEELHIASWLHDCGKITTPIHIMDKATKLEAIFDRIELVRLRVELLSREAEVAYLRALAAGEEAASELEARYEAARARLAEDLAFIERANIGGEFLAPEAQARIAELATRTVHVGGVARPLLEADEVASLSIARGTLSEDERLVINEHMVQTIQMLEALPFPRHLRHVPEYAGGHHERMDGGGYPRGIFAGDLAVPARLMAIADVFEALTAQDRPYKKGKSLSQAMRIMGFMKRDNHIDPDLFDLFVTSGTYRAYAEQYLPPELCDEVDEAALLAIAPKPYELPSEPERRARTSGFLPVYERRLRGARD
ncbi:MAG: GAF domain-containing protein [Deltaproteobacteria bacterium]|nr:GAF domain-containing protein [Deltaproteobacteria bacterium]